MIKQRFLGLALTSVLLSSVAYAHNPKCDDCHDPIREKEAALHYTVSKPKSAEAGYWNDFVKSGENIVVYVHNLSSRDSQAALWFLTTGGKYGFVARQATEQERGFLESAIKQVAISYSKGDNAGRGLQEWSQVSNANHAGHLHLQMIYKQIDNLKARVTSLEDRVSLLENSNKDLEKRLSTQKIDLENRLSTQKIDLEKRLSTQKIDLEKRLSTQKIDLEKRLSDQKAEAEAYKIEFNKKLTDQKQADDIDLEKRLSTQKIDLEKRLSDQKAEAEAYKIEFNKKLTDQKQADDIDLEKRLSTQKIDLEKRLSDQKAEAEAYKIEFNKKLSDQKQADDAEKEKVQAELDRQKARKKIYKAQVIDQKAKEVEADKTKAVDEALRIEKAIAAEALRLEKAAAAEALRFEKAIAAERDKAAAEREKRLHDQAAEREKYLQDQMNALIALLPKGTPLPLNMMSEKISSNTSNSAPNLR